MSAYSDFEENLKKALETVSAAAQNTDAEGKNINSPSPDKVWVEEVATAIKTYVETMLDES